MKQYRATKFNDCLNQIEYFEDGKLVNTVTMTHEASALEIDQLIELGYSAVE